MLLNFVDPPFFDIWSTFALRSVSVTLTLNWALGYVPMLLSLWLIIYSFSRIQGAPKVHSQKYDFFPDKHRRSWGNAEAGTMSRMAIVQKPCYTEAACQLPYDALV